MPKWSLKSLASSPIVMPWRIGIGIHSHERLVAGHEHRSFDLGSPDGVRPVAHDDLQAVLPRGLHAVGHRVDVGVDADADVLQVDHQHVEIAEHFSGRLARFAVERVHRHAADLVEGMPCLDHVVLHVRPKAVLGAENGCERGSRVCRDAVRDVPQPAVERCRVADDADTPAAELV